jgi:hypothetical protein
MNGLDYKVQIVIQDYLLLMDLVVNLQVEKNYDKWKKYTWEIILIKIRKEVERIASSWHQGSFTK